MVKYTTAFLQLIVLCTVDKTLWDSSKIDKYKDLL